MLDKKASRMSQNSKLFVQAAENVIRQNYFGELVIVTKTLDEKVPYIEGVAIPEGEFKSLEGLNHVIQKGYVRSVRALVPMGFSLVTSGAEGNATKIGVGSIVAVIFTGGDHREFMNGVAAKRYRYVHDKKYPVKPTGESHSSQLGVIVVKVTDMAT